MVLCFERETVLMARFRHLCLIVTLKMTLGGMKTTIPDL